MDHIAIHPAFEACAGECGAGGLTNDGGRQDSPNAVDEAGADLVAAKLVLQAASGGVEQFVRALGNVIIGAPAKPLFDGSPEMLMRAEMQADGIGRKIVEICDEGNDAGIAGARPVRMAYGGGGCEQSNAFRFHAGRSRRVQLLSRAHPKSCIRRDCA